MLRMDQVGPAIRTHARRQIALLPLLGLVPSFMLATYALTEPWAQARVIGFVGVARSPDAAMLLAVTLAGMVAATVAVATRSRRHGIAAAVHVVTGALMIAVTFAASSMIKHAGVKLLGVVPLASVRSGPGLRHFLIGSVLVIALGLLELALALRPRRRAATAPLEERVPAAG